MIKPTKPTVTIATTTGQQQTNLILAYTNSPLAITSLVDDDGIANGFWIVITHIPTGLSIPGAIAHISDLGHLTQLLERLAELPWDGSVTPDGHMQPSLADPIQTIIADWRGSYDPPTTTIKIITPQGDIQDKQVALVVAYTSSPLAITTSAHDPNSYSITHLPSGHRLGPSHPDQGELTQLLERLIALPWTDALTPDGQLNPSLRPEVMDIISDWQQALQSRSAHYAARPTPR